MIYVKNIKPIDNFFYFVIVSLYDPFEPIQHRLLLFCVLKRGVGVVSSKIHALAPQSLVEFFIILIFYYYGIR